MYIACASKYGIRKSCWELLWLLAKRANWKPDAGSKVSRGLLIKPKLYNKELWVSR